MDTEIESNPMSRLDEEFRIPGSLSGHSSKSSVFFPPGPPSLRQIMKRKYQMTALSTGKEAQKAPMEMFEELNHLSRFTPEDGKQKNTLHEEFLSKPATVEVTSMRVLAQMPSVEEDIEQDMQVELPAAAQTKVNSVSEVENPIPSIIIIPYVAVPSIHTNPIKVLQEFSEEWNTAPNYDVKVIRNGTGPTTFAVSVVVGIRKGEGNGATVSEAKAEAAAKCLEDLVLYLPPDRRIAYKPVVKTDPAKDILYVLHGICEDYNFKKPKYVFKQIEAKAVQCIATVGEIFAHGEASKKRVAVRIAAITVFKKLRKLYNAGKVPQSTFDLEK